MIHLMRKITNNNHKSITRVAVGAIVGGSSLIYYASNVSVLNPSQHMLRCKWSNMQDQDLFYPAFSHSGASQNSNWFLPFFISRTSFDASPSSSTSSSSSSSPPPPPPPPLPPLPPPPPSSFDIKKKISLAVHGGGSTKHYPRSKCLTRNTIANAAASVNPAVVTINFRFSRIWYNH
ncbi:unnamed protein product [Cuscuta epithymum]|uniref:Uncharacterized protein n=1 Tax=Cuscuta epithymum TaxID=186058 RepID=A0AAV0CC83_9ASTE|nr:unnamed protein product [Cuscuta epithymum]CAH9073753.1 unnamed protein product [Cuscuta epithymum]